MKEIKETIKLLEEIANKSKNKIKYNGYPNGYQPIGKTCKNAKPPKGGSGVPRKEKC
jgi:hypothetical protein